MSIPAPASRTEKGLPNGFDDPAFRRTRTRNWLVLGFLYAAFYMSRYNFAAVMVNLSATFGWSNTDLGIFETAMPLVYGLSVVFNGPIADRIGGRKAFLFGALGVVVMNLLFGLCISFVAVPAVMVGKGHDAHVLTEAVLTHGFQPRSLLLLMATIWGANGYFQSFGALSIVKVNAQWFHVRERGTFAGIFGVLIRFGLILAFSVVPAIATVLPLQYAFWIPGVFVGVLFVLNYLFMRDSPLDAGFTDLDTGDAQGVSDGKPSSLRFVLKTVFASPVTWTIALGSMMIGMVRRSTIDSWYPKYFKEVHLGDPTASLASYIPYQSATWGIALMGIAGGFAFGIASDRIFKGRRAPVVFIGFVGMAVILALFGLIDRMGAGPWGAALCLPLLSIFVNGAHAMIGGAASMDFGGRKAAATAAGLFDGMQYLASSLVGIGMGYTLDRWGWKAWQFVPIPFAIVGALLMLRIWNATPKGRPAH
jgi:OPA family glycerol-3-phosphate transporter-like MFS transporter